MAKVLTFRSPDEDLRFACHRTASEARKVATREEIEGVAYSVRDRALDELALLYLEGASWDELRRTELWRFACDDDEPEPA